jgi:hypothetical protein
MKQNGKIHVLKNCFSKLFYKMVFKNSNLNQTSPKCLGHSIGRAMLLRKEYTIYYIGK